MDQFVECIMFQEGIDANETFDILYPVGKSAGDKRTIKAAIEHLSQWDNGAQPGLIEKLEVPWASGVAYTREYIMIWNYAYNWIGLYRRVPKKDVKVSKPELLIGA